MAKGRILNKLLSSGVQAIAVQVLGILFFYFISLYFSKDNFGIISLANAICMFITTLLSFGMEQVVVRRIAVSKTSDWAAAAYFFHALAGSVFSFLVILLLHFLLGNSVALHYLPLFFTGQAVLFIASPLKQFLNARENFGPFGIIAITSGLGKIVAAIVLSRQADFEIATIAYIQIVAALFEIGCLLFYILGNQSYNFKFKFKIAAYGKLIKEAGPQYVAVIFDSSLSRMDWIILGLITTNVITADYSFAYRAFEMARLPIAIIAPVILPQFARMFGNNNTIDSDKKGILEHIFIIEMFCAISFVLILNILWTPLISYITHDKYGESNSLQFLILSLCIPLHFLINLLWTLCFTGKKYRIVSTITIISAVSNLLLNLALIPFWGGLGAAVSFLLTSIVQATGYYIIVRKDFILLPIKNGIFLLAIAFTCFVFSGMLTGNTTLRLLIGLGAFVLLSVLLRQVGKMHINTLRMLVKR